MRNQDAAGQLLTIGEFAPRAQSTTRGLRVYDDSDCYRQPTLISALKIDTFAAEWSAAPTSPGTALPHGRLGAG